MTVVVDTCADNTVYSLDLIDFIFMVKETAAMLATSPVVIASVAQEQINAWELREYKMHESESGIVHKVFEDELELFQRYNFN